MTKRREPFKVGEWYHCYNRSIEGRTAYEDSRDYFRFLELLYLANDDFPLRRDDMGIHPFEEILALPRGKSLVAIAAFCLMPSRFDLVVQEVVEGGITAFMRKLGTAYTLYFNSRHTRVGNLFLKPFQSLHASSDRSAQLISYVHTSPAVLYEPEWRTNHVVDPQFLEEHLIAYPYSSLGTYYAGARTPNAPILDAHSLSLARTVPLRTQLQEARRYSADSGIF